MRYTRHLISRDRLTRDKIWKHSEYTCVLSKVVVKKAISVLNMVDTKIDQAVNYKAIEVIYNKTNYKEKHLILLRHCQLK